MGVFGNDSACPHCPKRMRHVIPVPSSNSLLQLKGLNLIFIRTMQLVFISYTFFIRISKEIVSSIYNLHFSQIISSSQCILPKTTEESCICYIILLEKEVLKMGYEYKNNGFALLVVLFILLIIIGASYLNY